MNEKHNQESQSSTYGIYLILFGMISLKLILSLIGIFICLIQYFRNTFIEEGQRRKKNRELNELLKRWGRLN